MKNATALMALIICLFAVLFSSCWRVAEQENNDSDASVDTNSSGDIYGDTDVDTDADIDSDTYSDSNTGSDSYTDTDTDTDPLVCGGGRYDDSTGLCWQHPKAIENYMWRPAKNYCEDLDLGGHTDWVLPTRKNITDMLGGCDLDVLPSNDIYCSSCEESSNCTALFGSDNGSYWSVSFRVYLNSMAWLVYFSNGHLTIDDKESYKSVRCVREGP